MNNEEIIDKKIKKKLRDHFREVLKTKKSPESIALGFAIGTFIAVMPTFGFGPLIGVLVILIFERVSKISLFLSFLVWNPFVLAALYPVAYILGDYIIGEMPVTEIKLTFLQQVFVLTKRLLIGNLIMATFFSVVSYFILKHIVKEYEKNDKSK